MLLHDLIFKDAYLKSITVVYFHTGKENDEWVGYGFFKDDIVRLRYREQQRVLNVLCYSYLFLLDCF